MTAVRHLGFLICSSVFVYAFWRQTDKRSGNREKPVPGNELSIINWCVPEMTDNTLDPMSLVNITNVNNFIVCLYLHALETVFHWKWNVLCTYNTVSPYFKRTSCIFSCTDTPQRHE